MRRVVWALLVMSVAVGLAMLMRFNDGNVAILWPPYRVDVSVNLTVLILIVAFVALHWLLLALSGAWRLPTRIREYRQRRRRENALAALRDGLLALFEGRFGRAERLAQSASVDASLAGTASLVAARAAHRMRETERRDLWLEAARDDPVALQAQRMTSAELALEEHRPSDALAAIETPGSAGPRHVHGMRVALRAHELAEDWPALLRMLRALEKRDALPQSNANALRIRAYRALFSARAGDAAGVQKLCASLSADDLAIDEIVDIAARALAGAGCVEQAARMIERTLETRYADRLVAQYAGLDAVSPRERLKRAERWRARYGDEAVLLSTLGRLCATEGLWGKAEEFLVLAERAAPGPQAHLALARLYDAMGRSEDANLRFRLFALSGDETKRSSAA